MLTPAEKRVPTVSGIYEIKCHPVNKYYVGSSVNIPRRWAAHLCELNTGTAVNPVLQKLWNEHGCLCFDFRILEIVTDRDLLDVREDFWIRTLHADGLCVNRKNMATDERTGISLRSSTKRKLELLDKGSMDATLNYLLSLT